MRSWNVFRGNASELLELLVAVETNPGAQMWLTQDTAGVGEEQRAFQINFWASLDQRLHNMVSSAITLVDQTRPLIKHYEQDQEFIVAFTERSEPVKNMPAAAFLRRLRNYLLHCGAAPVAHTIHLGPARGEGGQWDNFEIQLSATGLLRWSGWTAASRDYVAQFTPGPPLRKLTEEYCEAMGNLYRWLFEQSAVLHAPPQHSS
jgi:hypothetical protein